MKNQSPQSSLILRLLAGGYLVYLGWNLYSTSAGDLKFQLAAGFFALVGAVLLGFSLRTLLKNSNFDPPKEE